MAEQEQRRPEMDVFNALGMAQGWRPDDTNYGYEVGFEVETTPTDSVRLQMQDQADEEGNLYLVLEMFPEDTLRGASPQEMAATIARWLRDTAAALEAAAERGGKHDA